MITTTSVLVRRRLSGALHKELRVETNDGCQPTAWEIIDTDGDAPYCMIDGHRHDLTEHEIKGLKKAVKGFLEEESIKTQEMPSGLSTPRQAGGKSIGRRKEKRCTK